MSLSAPLSDRAERDFLYPLFRFAARGIAALGISGIRRFGRIAGALVWFFIPSRRRLAVSNVKECLGISDTEARRIAYEATVSNLCSFLECVAIPQFSCDDARFIVENPELFRRIRESGRPIVAATAHLGAWELLASVHPIAHMPEKEMLVVVRRYNNRPFNRLITELRESRGCSIVGHRNAVRPVLKVLRSNGVVAFLVDHKTGDAESLRLPFLGKIASVNMGPAVLAVRSKALILPLALIRRGGSYCMHALEPLDTATLEGTYSEQVEAAARFYTQSAESLIHIAPEQWFWIHNRWK